MHGAWFSMQIAECMVEGVEFGTQGTGYGMQCAACV